MSVGGDAPLAPLVLVVDDEAILRLHAADTLEENGFRVVEAEDAKAALRLLADLPDVRVLLTDINMPGALDGLDLAREVHERWPAVRLMVTSSKLSLSGGDIPDAGRFVAKPYSPDTLVHEIHGLLAQASPDDEGTPPMPEDPMP